MSDKSKVATAPTPPKPLLAGGGAIRAIVPQDFESAYRMAQVVVAAGMAPKSVNTVEKACVAIMHGLEVGLTPMAALQSIAVVNGTPTIWGDGMLGLIVASGLLEDMEETTEVDEKGEILSATCTMKRKGRPTAITRKFTRAMASRAGLLKKEGPWTNYPDRMMPMRARAWCSRDAFADVLRGLHQTEEVMDRGMLDVTERGTSTTAEPRQSDFRPAQQREEAETWELFDEIGEMAGEREAEDWVAQLLHMATGKISDKERAQLLENNYDTAKAMWESDDASEMLMATLKGLYPASPAADGTKSWKLPEAIMGQEPKRKALLDLLAVAETKGDVDAIQSEHAEFIGKLGRIRAETDKAFTDRRDELPETKAAA